MAARARAARPDRVRGSSGRRELGTPPRGALRASTTQKWSRTKSLYLVGRVTKHGASLARVASHGKKPKTLEARGILPAGGKRLARLAESGYHYSPLIESSPPGDSSLWFFSATRSGSDTYGRGVSQRLENLLGGSAGGRELAPETVRFAAPLWCPPPVGLDRHLRGLVWFIAEVRSHQDLRAKTREART